MGVVVAMWQAGWHREAGLQMRRAGGTGTMRCVIED